MSLTLDPTDQRLIELLENNARQSSGALARQLNVSAPTVRRRLNRLIDNGIIRICAATDSAKIGRPLMAVITVDVVPGESASAVNALARQHEVRWAAATTGQFGAVAVAHFYSTDELATFLEEKVKKLRGVAKCQALVCLHVRRKMWPKSLEFNR